MGVVDLDAAWVKWLLVFLSFHGGNATSSGANVRIVAPAGLYIVGGLVFLPT